MEYDATRVSTGSRGFDNLLGGGLPVASITDVYGAAGTGKTQFAFQNAVTTSSQFADAKPSVVFVDCAGSFRPERIVGIAKARGINETKVLEGIFTIYVRGVDEQRFATERVATQTTFEKCRLVIVDDATSNYIVQFDDEEITRRQVALSLYARSLALLAFSKNLSIIITNSARSRRELGEGEATGEIFSQFALYRLHFTRKNRERFATLLQPRIRDTTIRFEITDQGVV